MWIPIAKIDDAIEEHGRGLEINGDHVALFRIAGTLHATSNVCTHQFALLTEGSVEGEYVECPMHQGRFHIPTGAAQGAPVCEALRVYPLRCVDGDVQIDLREEACHAAR